MLIVLLKRLFLCLGCKAVILAVSAGRAAGHKGRGGGGGGGGGYPILKV